MEYVRNTHISPCSHFPTPITLWDLESKHLHSVLHLTGKYLEHPEINFILLMTTALQYKAQKCRSLNHLLPMSQEPHL